MKYMKIKLNFITLQMLKYLIMSCHGTHYGILMIYTETKKVLKLLYIVQVFFPKAPPNFPLEKSKKSSDLFMLYILSVENLALPTSQMTKIRHIPWQHWGQKSATASHVSLYFFLQKMIILYFSFILLILKEKMFHKFLFQRSPRFSIFLCGEKMEKRASEKQCLRVFPHPKFSSSLPPPQTITSLLGTCHFIQYVLDSNTSKLPTGEWCPQNSTDP